MKINRNRGEFYTPPHIVKHAYNYISEFISPNWHNAFLVWDNCCGKGNLIRYTNIKDLIATTLEQNDIDYILQNNILSPNSVIQQLDFLNDEIPSNIVNKITNDKPLLFLMNPPFVYPGRSHLYSAKRSVGNVNDTFVRQLMKQHKIKFGIAQKQLTSQFIFRCVDIARKCNIKKYYICTFSRLKLLTSQSFNNFNRWLLSNLNLLGGFIFNSNNFEACAGEWPVAFLIYESSNNKNITNNEVTLDILNTDGKKQITIINNNRDKITNYIAPKTNVVKETEIYTMSSWLKIQPKQKFKLPKSIICYASLKSNDVTHSKTETILLSLPYSHVQTSRLFVDESNFTHIINYVAARLLSPDTWIYQHDEYSPPSKQIQESRKFKVWSANSLVYVIFSSANHCISLDNSRVGRVKNELCWFDGPEKRYAYTLINQYKQQKLLYDETLNILSLATKLAEIAKSNDKSLLWDAGYRQLKTVWEKHNKKLHKEFKNLYKLLEQKLKPGVFEFGWLQK